jgi:hypothetical protein
VVIVATYLWNTADAAPGKHSYNRDDVRLLQQMVKRHLKTEHQFVVFTDRPEQFANDANIAAIQIDWEKHVPGTCFVRLLTFSPKLAAMFGHGTRLLQLDLDMVIVGSIDAIVDREEDLVLWRNPRRWVLTFPDVGYAARLAWFNCSILLHRCGTRPDLCEDFDPASPSSRGDQWYLSDRLGKDCPHWDGADGVYRLATADRPYFGVYGHLPENACVVAFPGDAGKPWRQDTVESNPWIAEHRF